MSEVGREGTSPQTFFYEFVKYFNATAPTSAKSSPPPRRERPS